MNLYYCKKLNMIGFDKKYFSGLFYESAIKLLGEQLENNGLVLSDLQGNKKLMNEITDKVVAIGIKKKEDIEIFVALDFIITFCPENSQLFFTLKNGVDHKKISINNINDFKNIVEEKTITDFATFFNREFRQFQLKQYRNELETNKILQFITDNLKKYGDDLGEVNLLVLLQGKNKSGNFQKCEIDFYRINNELNNKNYNFSGQILISYNEQNKKHIINQVYPSLTTSQRDVSDDDLADSIIDNKSI